MGLKFSFDSVVTLILPIEFANSDGIDAINGIGFLGLEMCIGKKVKPRNFFIKSGSFLTLSLVNALDRARHHRYCVIYW